MVDIAGATSGAVRGERKAADLAARFPADFAWGFATSAYQIEGAVDEDGRGPSIWDTFSREPGKVDNGDTGCVACDHYHRWPDDVALMADLGARAYRFSVSWPRVLPAGIGAVNEAGVGFYERLVDGLLAAGIRPVLTLYHWDLPQALQDKGGWADRQVVDWFAEYARLVAGRLGDRVGDWITLNEPQVFAFTGHAFGRHAPGLRDWPTALRVADHALHAHAAAARAIRAAVGGARVGVAVDVNHTVAASAAEEDVLAAERLRQTRQRWFLDPLFGRGYPRAAMEDHAAAGHLDGLELGDPPPGELDFLGLNYYSRETVAADRGDPFGARHVPPSGTELTQMGWQVEPDGLGHVLRWIDREYAPNEIVISENGAAFPDTLDGDGEVRDEARQRYLARHVSAAADALEAGVPLTGYYAWSLLDNFEWSHGYSKRFGLVHVDFATQRRTVKQSGRWYSALLHAAR